jgi:hypothetical protein
VKRHTVHFWLSLLEKGPVLITDGKVYRYTRWLRFKMWLGLRP